MYVVYIKSNCGKVKLFMGFSTIEPFLRWAGGKRWLIKKIDELLPDNINNYYEPFLGGGSMFFHLTNKNLIKGDAYLSDTNGELINSYIQIRDNIEDIIYGLKFCKNDKEYYENVRTTIIENEIYQAIRFLYLNRTSFNGLYRVNKKGEYNVPFGNRKVVQFSDDTNLRNISDRLKGHVKITTNDFSWIGNNVLFGDFVFFDPPYTVAHGLNGFIAYNQLIFSWKDQERLKDLLIQCNEKGVNFMMTNAYHSSIINLFKIIPNIKIKIMHRSSLIGGKGATRGLVKELLLTNY